MSINKDKNIKDLRKQKKLRGWQEYTQKELKKKGSMPRYVFGMITHPEPDILEYDVKWALEHILNKTNGTDEIQLNCSNPKVMLFIKCTQYVSKVEHSAAIGWEKSICNKSQKKDKYQIIENYHTAALIPS